MFIRVQLTTTKTIQLKRKINLVKTFHGSSKLKEHLYQIDHLLQRKAFFLHLFRTCDIYRM